MVAEIDYDSAPPRKLYQGKQLSAPGRAAYPGLLRQAALSETPEWLAARLAPPGTFNPTYPYLRAGTLVTAKVPSDAHDRLAGGEFNRFYIRGLCLRAFDEKVTGLQIYRALPVSSPRAESEAAIGRIVTPGALLEDLRATPGEQPLHNLPGGPNSGISVRYEP